MRARAPHALPPVPPVLRYAVAGAVVALLAYLLWQIESPAEPVPPDAGVTEFEVSVPQLDTSVLANALDDTHEHRLRLEVEPLRHLLGKAIDVGPTVAASLGMPDTPVPVASVQADPGRFRHDWLWYEGELEELSGPHEGHPIKGWGIHEATVRLAGGEHVLVAFSLPPPPDMTIGSWVRVEGYFLKLRDLALPRAIDRAPMLVGRQLLRDYEDWGPVTELDGDLLARVDDDKYASGDLAMRTIEEDQCEALWHLAAYARDTAAARTAGDWRRMPALSEEWHRKVMTGEIARGSPMRVSGVLVKRTTLAAPPNPAGIKAWTAVWIQVREYGGKLVPVWVGKRVAELPPRAPLEVRAFYYRRFVYDTEAGDRRLTPLFVAADLDLLRVEVDKTLRTIGLWLAAVVGVVVALLWWGQRRVARASDEHSRDMDARRRRRREREAGIVPPGPPAADA